MDRTLTRRGTWGLWLRFWLREEAPWRVLLLPLLLGPLLAYGAGWLGRGALKAKVQAVVMGRRVAGERVRAAAGRYAAHVVASEVFDGAREALGRAKARGAVVVIASASNAYYVQAIGAALGVDAVIATEMDWEGDWLVARLSGPNCYGEAKAGLVRGWLEGAGMAGARVDAWSDHVSDLPLLELAVASGGTAVAVNASAGLRAVAAARGWAVLDWGVVRESVWERA
jgi:HAD superfamily phosphoserine phosphatase-like hydrolase